MKRTRTLGVSTMMKFRELRVRNGLNARQMAAVIGCTHPDLTKMERKEINNRASIAVFVLLEADFARNASTLLWAWTKSKEPIAGYKRVEDLKQAAEKLMDESEHSRWVQALNRRVRKYGVLLRAD